MHDHRKVGGPFASIGDRGGLVSLQEIGHHETLRSLLERERVHLTDDLERRHSVISAHGALQDYDVAQSELLFVAQELVDDLRECVQFRYDQICDPFLLDHVPDVLIIVKIEFEEKRDGCSGHVQTI